ncbi:hypothetical protein AB0F16_35480, partial [Streptomyces tanashiensis]|uniref:hypothetical protein n=1 Tax=Streptomyces tanashiensis TaxID=67367 RepID=UPI00340CB2F9
MATTTAAHGTWPSPVSAALAAARDGRPEYLGAVGSHPEAHALRGGLKGRAGGWRGGPGDRS